MCTVMQHVLGLWDIKTGQGIAPLQCVLAGPHCLVLHAHSVLASAHHGGVWVYCMSLGCALNRMHGCFVGPHLAVAAVWLPFTSLSLLSHPISPRIHSSPWSAGRPIMRSIDVCAGAYRCTLRVHCRSHPRRTGSMHVGRVHSPWPPFVHAHAVVHNRRGST